VRTLRRVSRALILVTVLQPFSLPEASLAQRREILHPGDVIESNAVLFGGRPLGSPMYTRGLEAENQGSLASIGPSPSHSVQVGPPTDTRPETGKLVAAGTLGGFIGFFGGALLGASVAGGEGEYDALGGLLVGAMVGSVVAVPTAVHLANGHRGSFPYALGGSALVGALGCLTTVTFFLAPFGMIAASVRIEQATWR